VSGEYAALVRAAMDDARPSGAGWVRCYCPICPLRLGKVDRKRSLGIKPESNCYHCFRCSAHGWLGDVPEGIRRMAPQVDPAKQAEARRPPEGFAELSRNADAVSLAPARAYLRGRGIREELWAEAGIGACATGRMAGRVVVPIRGLDGDWVGWVSRTWTKKAPRPYLYPEGMPRGVVLYNHDALLVETDEPVLVVEGVFDVLALWPSAVALLGKASAWQVQALAACPRPVAVVMDGDAHDEGFALAARLRLEGQRAGSVTLPPRADPDEVPLPRLRELARRSLDTFEPAVL
jgi:DNA primase